jgi:hypothetical protein
MSISNGDGAGGRVYILTFYGSPAISVNLKQEREHREKVASAGADLVCPRSSHILERSPKLRVSLLLLGFTSL